MHFNKIRKFAFLIFTVTTQPAYLKTSLFKKEKTKQPCEKAFL